MVKIMNESKCWYVNLIFESHLTEMLYSHKKHTKHHYDKVNVKACYIYSSQL